MGTLISHGSVQLAFICWATGDAKIDKVLHVIRSLRLIFIHIVVILFVLTSKVAVRNLFLLLIHLHVSIL